MFKLRGDRLEEKGDLILMHGDNMSAVAWAYSCGGARDKRFVLLMMRTLSRVEVSSGWSHVAKHISGIKNTLADGTSRWPRPVVAKKVKALTNDNKWAEQPLRTRGARNFETVLKPISPDTVTTVCYGIKRRAECAWMVD